MSRMAQLKDELQRLEAQRQAVEHEIEKEMYAEVIAAGLNPGKVYRVSSDYAEWYFQDAKDTAHPLFAEGLFYPVQFDEKEQTVFMRAYHPNSYGSVGAWVPVRFIIEAVVSH